MAGNAKMTRHALQRALDMRLEPAQIQSALENPTVIPSRHAGTEYWQSGSIALAVKTDRGYPAVVTVLWSTEQAFLDDMQVAPFHERSGKAFFDVKAQ